MVPSKDQQDTSSTSDALDEGLPISVPDSGDTGEGGKLKMIVQLVKKCFGVKDIASMRLSLPASLLKPIANLEYSQLLDRPDMLAAINDYDDPFERMLAVLRWTLTKDMKYARGKVGKPYNSVLGEHFRNHWDVLPVSHPTSEPDEPPIPQTDVTEPILGTEKPKVSIPSASDNSSIRSGRSSTSYVSSFKSSITDNDKNPSTAATTPQQDGVDDVANRVSFLNLNRERGKVRVVYLTEQISHRPPISFYYGLCPDRHVELSGIDHIVLRLSGTVLKGYPGARNKGMVIRLTGGRGAGEIYHVSHPVGNINGLFRGNFYATISESSIITCTTGRGGKQFRTILEFIEEPWLGKANFAITGVIYTVSEGDTQHEEWTKVKHVPPSRVVAVFDGSWRGLVRWKRVGTGSYPSHTISKGAHTTANSPNPSHTALPSPSNHNGATSKADLMTVESEWCTLIDLSTLWVITKQVRPLEKQEEKESRKLWDSVTRRILKKEFSEANREKVAIEQRQRDEAAERKRRGVQFVPRFFLERELELGIPVLSEEGKKAVEEEMMEAS